MAAPEKVDCSKVEEVLDDLGAAQGFSTLNDKYKLATTADELTARCKEMTEAIKTLRKYNKDCYTSLTQQVMSATLRTRSQMNEKYCAPDSAEFKEAVEASKCIVDNALDKVKEAEKQSIVVPQAVFDANISDNKLRTRRSCCSVLAIEKLFLEATKDKCSKHEKLYTDYVKSYTSDSMGLICPDQDKLDCGSLEALKTEGVAPKTKFFLNPTVKLVKTLDH